MKRWWCLFFAGFLSGCGDGVTRGNDYVDSAVDSTAADTNTDSTTDAATETSDTTTETTSETNAETAADTANDSVVMDSELVDADDTGALDTSYDGPLPTISVDDVAIAEGNSGEKTITFNLSLSAAMPVPVSVRWATADGTAVSTTFADYVALTGKVVFGPGIINVPVDIKVLGDTTIEPDEIFYLDLSEPVNGTLDKARGKATILDDDTAGPSISIADVAITEGNLGTKDVDFVVTLSAAATKTVTVSWSTVDGTARSAGTTTGETDYAPGSGTLSFAPGETSKTITVSLRSDTLDEPDESFDVELSSATNGTISKNRGTATITDDDAPPSISINDVSLPEGASGGTKVFVFEVTLSAASGRTITVAWATANGTALAPSDYVASSGTLTFAPGDTKRTIGITVRGDNVIEPDKTFNINLTAPTDATIAKGAGLGTIVNDD